MRRPTRLTIPALRAAAAAAAAAAATFSAAAPAHAAMRYVITDTGIPMPSLTAPPFRPARINASGQIAGWSFTNGAAAPKFFLYSNGSVTYLPSPNPTSTSVQFADINDNGDTIGTYNPVPGAPHGYVYSNGALTDLGTFLPRAINNAGVMVGATPSGPAIYDHGTLTYLSALGASRVTDISDDGHAIGNTTSSASGPTFVYYNGTLTNLGSLGIPRAVNDSGEIAGEDSSSGTPQSFVYSPLFGGTHKFTPFGYAGLGPPSATWAYDITNNHLVVGAVTVFSPYAVSRDLTPPAAGSDADIDSHLAYNSPRWSFDNAYSINPSGQILAVGTDPPHGVTTTHLILATPTPFNTLSPIRPYPAVNVTAGQQAAPLDVPNTSNGVADFTTPASFSASNHPLVLLHLDNADPAFLASLVPDRPYAGYAFTLLSDASTGWQLDLWHSLQSRFGPTWTCAAFYTNYTGPSTFSFAWDFSLAPTTTVDRLLLTPLTCDLNLDGRLDPDDYALLDRGLSRHLTGWTNGDLNADGTINQNDYLLIDSTYAQTHPLSPALLSQRESQFGPAYVSTLLASVPSVPEPTSLFATCSLALLPLTRRRTRSKFSS